MVTDTRERIIAYLRERGQGRVHDLQQTLQMSNVAVHKQLNKLLHEGQIIRVGKPPLVFYTLPPDVRTVTQTHESEQISASTQQVIDAHFLSITPDGRLLYGLVGFAYWAQHYQKNKSLATLAQEYAAALQVQKQYVSPEGWIDATAKLRETFTETPITQLLFADVYSYRVFGRTKLAKLVMYAKQVGARALINQISDRALPMIERIIKTYTIDAIAYIPPTIPRPVQFMDVFASRLQLPLPEIKLVKVVPGDIPIPQKTLASVAERTMNARETIYLKNSAEPSYANVLLLDDVIGSGASFHETAKKLRAVNIGHNRMIAFGLVGNIKGYDVVREI